MKHKKSKRKTAITLLKSMFWFSMGGALGLFLFSSFVFIFFQKVYVHRIYPGIIVAGQDFGGKEKESVRTFFTNKNEEIANTSFLFKSDSDIATVSAKDLDVGYDGDLLSDQAYSIGRSDNTLSNISLVLQAYVNGIYFPPSYRYSDKEFEEVLSLIQDKIAIKPVDALFQFQNGRVIAFQPSSDGQEVDMEALKKDLEAKIPFVFTHNLKTVVIQIPIKILKPAISTDQVNSLGIRELIGTGTSLFRGSILNRIYNITLATSRFNGVLVAPGETFSFNKVLGDISEFTGYKQAYVIQDGKTILGDGGGVCQVSTTFFRALLNAGLPIVERYAHAYRVRYYEQDSSPGFDATIYVPGVDLKFKNDTGNHILIQTSVNPVSQQLTFELYGTKDGREVSITNPTVSNQVPAPEPIYQDDPTLPKGTVKQVDFAAAGARVEFRRTVTKDGKILTSGKFISNFRPWQAVFLRGTQE